MGDVLAGLESWLSGSGCRISGVTINGETATSSSLDEAFVRDLQGIETLDIIVSSWTDLALQAYLSLREDCVLYGHSSFDERAAIRSQWEQDGSSPSAAARFLKEEAGDFYDLAQRSFRGEGLSSEDLVLLIDERLRELENPQEEILNTETLITGIAQRLEDLPLDIQTGKDSRAAETVQLFSRIGEKLFRLLNLMRLQGLPIENFTVDGMPVRDFIEDFGAALRELTSAYENRDAVLVGDLAEYELAPRLLKFFSGLKGGEGNGEFLSAGGAAFASS